LGKRGESSHSGQNQTEPHTRRQGHSRLQPVSAVRAIFLEDRQCPLNRRVHGRRSCFRGCRIVFPNVNQCPLHGECDSIVAIGHRCIRGGSRLRFIVSSLQTTTHLHRGIDVLHRQTAAHTAFLPEHCLRQQV